MHKSIGQHVLFEALCHALVNAVAKIENGATIARQHDWRAIIWNLAFRFRVTIASIVRGFSKKERNLLSFFFSFVVFTLELVPLRPTFVRAGNPNSSPDVR
jgi:hypothetical protein